MNSSKLLSQSVDTLTRADAILELAFLTKEIAKHDKLYYAESTPIVEDSLYDSLRQRIVAIEKQFPELVTRNSVSSKIGAPPSTGFEKVQHKVPTLSLGNAFADNEIDDFINKIFPSF